MVTWLAEAMFSRRFTRGLTLTPAP